MEEFLAIFINNWVAICGMLIVNVGLIISILGAIKIYKADTPRNEWILESAYQVASKPSYGVIAPNGYSPQAEISQSTNKAKELGEQITKFNEQNKKEMLLIFCGFGIQFVGNMFWGFIYLYA